MLKTEVDNFENYDPEEFLKLNGKMNHIDFMELISNELALAGVRATFAYPEIKSSVTLEVIERGPSTFGSKVLNTSKVMDFPYSWKERTNITNNTEESFKIRFMDNVLRVTVFDENTLDAEKTAYVIETLITKKYSFFRKYVDNLGYKGRLNPGFSSAYNDRKLYIIPLLIEFRTSEIFYESSPLIRSVNTEISVTG